MNGPPSSSNVPRGTSNTSCSHFVKENGIVWPRCKVSLDGPLPVYKKKGSPASYLSRILSKSRCEKKRPRLNQRCGLWPVRRSKRWRRSSSINLVAHFLFAISEWLRHEMQNLGALRDGNVVEGKDVSLLIMCSLNVPRVDMLLGGSILLAVPYWKYCLGVGRRHARDARCSLCNVDGIWNSF